MKVKVYGLGDEFRKEKFNPIKNGQYTKPLKGGLWASPVDSEWGWVDWCKAKNFGDLSSVFEIEIDGNANILKIDSFQNAKKLAWISEKGFGTIDFETMAKEGIDAIWLTEKGERETRYSLEYNMNGWDCECVLILNPDIINKEVQK